MSFSGTIPNILISWLNLRNSSENYIYICTTQSSVTFSELPEPTQLIWLLSVWFLSKSRNEAFTSGNFRIPGWSIPTHAASVTRPSLFVIRASPCPSRQRSALLKCGAASPTSSMPKKLTGLQCIWVKTYESPAPRSMACELLTRNSFDIYF